MSPPRVLETRAVFFSVFCPTFPSLRGFYVVRKDARLALLLFPETITGLSGSPGPQLRGATSKTEIEEASQPRDNSLSAPLSGRTLRG